MRYGQICILLGSIIASGEGVRFTIEPENKVAALSQPLWWHCHAEDDGIVTYSWKRDGNQLPSRSGQSIFSNGTLLISKVESDDVGNYTCIVEAGNQVLSSSEASLELAYISTTFSLSPKGETVILGDPVLLQCKIDSLPAALITWTRNGENVTTDTVTREKGGESTYRVYPVMYPNAGNYKCEGRNPLLNVVRYSDVGELIVQGPPVFTSSLRSVSVPLGLTATFDCRFEGNPEPRVAWFIHRQHSDGNVTSREITSSRKYMVYPNGTFEIYDVTEDDVAFYTCRVSNDIGVMSDSAHLNTSGNPTLPMFTTRPVDQTIKEGENATFICQAESNPPPTVAWMFKGVEMPSVDGHLTIINAKPSDAGAYVCVVENGVGYKNIDATLNVLVGPSFVTRPEDLTVVQGSRASISCRAAGNPTPIITWTTPNSGDLTSSSLTQDGISVSADGSLVIGYVERKHHGIYTCTAANEVGTVLATAQLTVEVSPSFTKFPVSYGVQVGERAMFHCQATGYPTPSMFWSKDGEGMITSAAHRQIYLNNSLVIHSVKTGDRGVYRCHAFNTRGSIEAPATLTVIVPPSFSVRPTSQKVRIGDDVSLDCVAIGDPVPTQKWNKDGRHLVLEDNMNLLSNYTLFITGIRANQFGDYVCVATNIADSISTSARLQTEDFPILTIRPSSITVNTSAAARLQCKGEALEAPSTHWLRLTGEGALDVRSNDRVTVTVDGEMIIQNVQPSDEGWYQCVVANSVGNVSENAFINVLVPPRITHTNSPQTTVIYAGVTLTCQSTGDPAPSVQWINPIGQEIASTSSYVLIDNTLEIVTANEDSDGGFWTCKACNLLGCDESRIEVKVEGPPIIHSINGSQTVTSVILNCFTSGEPEPSVTFIHEGQDVTLNYRGHRVIRNALHVDRDNVLLSYICEAVNRHGQAEEQVSVPSLIAPPTIITSASREITMNWSAPVDLGGLPLLGYQIEATPDLAKTWLKQDFLFTSTNGSLTELSPYTNYQVRIAGVNILGVGIFSDLSETVMTDADAPSPPTNVTVTVGLASILVAWNQSKFFNGDKEDIVYRYTVSIPHPVQTYVSDSREPFQSEERNETLHHSGSVSANQDLDVILEGLTDSAVYTVTVWAVNVMVNKSSEPVIVLADLTLTVSEEASVSPDTVLAIVFGIIGGIILILVIVFAVTQIRQMRKTRSMSLVNHRLSLDQFYMESPKNLYGKKSKFSMKRSSSQGFYKFDNDESFHSAGSMSKENGSALKDKHEDKDVLLTARNPLYGADVKDLSSELTVSPASKRATAEQSCEQAEIEIPDNNFTLKSVPDEKTLTLPSERINDHMTNTDTEAELEEIYSISKESEDSHIYEVPNLVSRSHLSRETSPAPSTKSNNSRSKPIRVISLEQLRGSPPVTSQQGQLQTVPVSSLESPTDEGEPERELFNVPDISETPIGEETDLLPHKKIKTMTKKEASPPKDIKVRYDLSEKDIERDLWSAALY